MLFSCLFHAVLSAGIRRDQCWTDRMVVFCIGLILTTCLGPVAQAQERLGVRPGGRFGTPSLTQSEGERPSQSPPGQVLPPVTPLPAEEAEQLPLPRVFVGAITVTGNTVFTADELATVTAPYANRELTTEDLEELRLALTRYYVTHGYVTSGAILPDQSVAEGVLTLHIIEGKLSRITIDGNTWFRAGYIRRRLALGTRPPLRIMALQQRLQLLQLDDRIERLKAELTPGAQRGESTLHVRVEETLPFSVVLGVNNYQSPAVGAERGFLTLAHQNLTGHGDILSATLLLSSELDGQIDASYALPLTARDTTLILQYHNDETTVVEAPFDPLDIQTESDTFGLTLRQPLYRTLRQELALALIGEREHSETSLLGESFSFSPGAVNGESTITALRLALEWTDRTQNQVIAARSRFTLGVDALGATIHDNSAIPDGQFFAWLGQFQWARRLGAWDVQLLFRLDVQLVDDPLLPLEQIAIGGRFSVRGYRENQLVRDNGLIVSLEARLPFVRNTPWADVVELAPFVDFGRAWNHDLELPNLADIPTPAPAHLVSIGIGLRWAITIRSPVRLRPQFELYWGYPLKDVDTPGGDLQDVGLHFQLVIAAL